jgi:dUTPase
MEVRHGELVVIDTGIGIAESPDDVVYLVLPRSGLWKRGLIAGPDVHLLGAVDSDYRGTIKVGLRNQAGHTVALKGDEPVAQLLPIRLAFTAGEVSTVTPTDQGGINEETDVLREV